MGENNFNDFYNTTCTTCPLTLTKKKWKNSSAKLFEYGMCYHRFITAYKEERKCTDLDKIFETQPWLTRNCLDISQGRTPLWANSTIRCRTTSGSGRPFTNTPPNWLTPPWPGINYEIKIENLNYFLIKNEYYK